MTHPFFAETNPAIHRDLRKRVSKAYSMSYILNMEKFIDPLIEDFRTKIGAFNGVPLDLSEWTQYFAFDAVGELAFGKSFGFIHHETDFNGLLSSVWVYMTSTAAFGFLPGRADAGKSPVIRWIVNNSYLKRLGKRLYCDPRIPFEKVRFMINRKLYC